MIREHLDEIAASLSNAIQHEQEIAAAMLELEQAGIYPAIASEQWQARGGGEAKYLYMLFRLDPSTGTYTGPDSKRKLYIGADEIKIAEARRLNANRRAWEALQSHRNHLRLFIDSRKREIASVAANARRWPRTYIEPALPPTATQKGK
jgi:hypothetical protein